MRRVRLLLQFMGLGSFYGLLAGPVLGLVYYLVVFQFSMSLDLIYFIALGVFCGSLLGGINGSILGIATVIIQAKLTGDQMDAARYRQVLLSCSIIATLVSSYLLFNAVQASYAVVNNNERLNPVILWAMLLAISASVYESRVISRWYLNQAEKPLSN
jgi:hypothetical protein